MLAIAAVAGIVRDKPVLCSAALVGTVRGLVLCKAAVLLMVLLSVDCNAAVAGTVRLNVDAAGTNVGRVTCMSFATPAVPEFETKFTGLSEPEFALLSNQNLST